MKFDVIGYGYWVPNVDRNLSSLERIRVCSIADLHAAARERACAAYPGAVVTADANDVVKSTEIDAVAIISSISYFVDCIESGEEPFNNGQSGLHVVRMLEAAIESLQKRGSLVHL